MDLLVSKLHWYFAFYSRYNYIKTQNCKRIVINFIQLVSSQPVDQFLQTKLDWKAPNKSYSNISEMTEWIYMIKLILESAYQIISNISYII